MRNLCVYCGSSFGARESYRQAAAGLAREMVRRGIGLVYGGGTPGLMGVMADSVLAAGGEVTGVITRYLRDKELAHAGLARLYVTESMHERKALMAHLADGFVALPGGLGTLEEIVEAISWGQIDLHRKPCGLLDTEGFYEGLTRFLDFATAQRFIRPEHRGMIVVAPEPQSLLDRMAAYVPPAVSKFASP